MPPPPPPRCTQTLTRETGWGEGDGGGDEAEEETEATYLYQARAVMAPSPGRPGSGVAVGSGGGGGGGVACGSDSRELREVSDANSRPRVRQINDAAASSLAPASMVWFPARHKVGTATSKPQLLMPLLTALARLHRNLASVQAESK